MKNIIIALISTTVFYACQTSTNSEQTTEPEETISVVQAGLYGESIDVSDVEDLGTLHQKLAEQDSALTKVQGTIVQTCAAKGCWMKVAMTDGDTLRVTFKDYGFFVPKSGMEGKEVIFKGIAKNDVTSVETLQHFAKDGGASDEEIAAITEVKNEISFVASGVLIKGVE